MPKKVQPAVEGEEAVENIKAPKAKQAAGKAAAAAAASKAQAAAGSRAAPNARKGGGDETDAAKPRRSHSVVETITGVKAPFAR